jgi:hypothetical protein
MAWAEDPPFSCGGGGGGGKEEQRNEKKKVSSLLLRGEDNVMSCICVYFISVCNF